MSSDHLKSLLRQARAWFSPHPTRRDAVSVCFPKAAEVEQWMKDTDNALLDETPINPTPLMKENPNVLPFSDPA